MPSRRDAKPAGRASRLPAPPPLFRPATPDAPEPGLQQLRGLLLRRWPGRTLLGGLAVRLLVLLAEWSVGESLLSRLIGVTASLAVIVGGVVLLVWIFQRVRTRMLWRVRERLIVSYLFIAVVPALLMGVFFLFAIALLIVAMTSYLFRNAIEGIKADTQLVATNVATELDRSGGGPAVEDILSRQVGRVQQRFPGLSIVVVPRQADRRQPTVAAVPARARTSLVRAGAWAHMRPPDRIPAWLSKSSFNDLIAHAGNQVGLAAAAAGDDPIELVVRAVAHSTSRDWSVVVDVPLDESVWASIEQSTGIHMIALRPRDTGGMAGAAAASVVRPLRYMSTPRGGKWVAEPQVFLPAQEWDRAAQDDITAQLRVAPNEIYQRVSSAQGQGMAEVSAMVFGIIAFLFLIVQGSALAMGWALARSITGSVHALFTGTERLRLGDLGHRIPIRSRDQLGELAESFNAMTANIETLLEQAAEKRRLEEELRIARDIQMSLLPRHAALLPGVSLAALCVPAREVGGDYYDFFALGGRRLGLLVADVAGKGTSAALYMAELKGLMLSLSQIHESPRQLLIEVDRIIANNLDARSFITMAYAIVDLDRQTLTYARAGHTPLLHRATASPARASLFAPSGMVVGLQLDGLEHKFAELLEEQTLPLVAGDVFVLYTDGVSEAMNADGEMFGEERLRLLVEEHGDLGADGLRERIVRDVEAFVGGADPHDDMTLIVIAVDQGMPA